MSFCLALSYLAMRNRAIKTYLTSGRDVGDVNYVDVNYVDDINVEVVDDINVDDINYAIKDATSTTSTTSTTTTTQLLDVLLPLAQAT